ncbi:MULTISPECIES: TonB-dependent receptor [Chitinophagaceae]
MYLGRIISAIVLAFFFTVSLAQTNIYSLNGYVFNAQKEPVSGASVRILENGKMTTTDSSGYFAFSGIASKLVSMEISAQGFQVHTLSIDIALQEGPLSIVLSNHTKSLENISVYGYSPILKTNRQAYNVTAVDAQKFQNTTLDIAHVLDRIPSARLRESGGVGSDFDFAISGFSGKRVRYFLDGVPVDYMGASFQINNIPVNLAERIEVYKGVVPIWLGSDALGGAVNIITGNKLRNFLDVSCSYGSFNTFRTNINMAVTSKKGFTFRLNAFQNYSDNDYKVTVDAADLYTGRYTEDTTVRRFHDKYHNETAIAQWGFVDKKWTDQFLVGITLGQYRKEIQTGARIEAVFGNWHTKGNIVMPTLKYLKKDLLIKDLNVVVNANYNLGQDQSIDTVHARYNWLGDSINFRGRGGESWHGYSLYKYKNNIGNAAATLTYELSAQHSIGLNNVFSHFDRKGFNAVAPYSPIDDIPQKADKNILGLSYQYRHSEKWNTTVFGKYLYQNAHTTLILTDAMNSGDTTYQNASVKTSKLGYGLATSYFLQTQLQVKFSYEKANRLPESDDIFGDAVNKEGNWNLKPESSDNINLGINYTWPIQDHRLYFSATGIYYHAKNFIYYTFNSYSNTMKAENLLDVSNKGLEAEVRYSYKRFFTAGINGTYQNIRDRQKYRIDLPGVESNTYGERIPNIPYLYGNADASIFFENVFTKKDRLSIGYNLLYVQSFYLYWANEGAADSKRTIPEQLAHDANIVYVFKEGRYNLAFECRNLTDKRLYDNFSLQKPGRAFSIKFRYFINR